MRGNAVCSMRDDSRMVSTPSVPKLRCTDLADPAARHSRENGRPCSAPVSCEYHRGSRRPSLANRTRALFQECGCSQSFPARGTYARQLREFVHHNPSKHDAELLVATTADEVGAGSAPTAVQARQACLGASCIASKRLAGRWILFMGDSTQRALHDAFLALLGERFGMNSLTVQPHLDGLPVKDRDRHKDYDTVFLHPARELLARRQQHGAKLRRGRPQKEPECFGPLHPECAAEARARPDLRWWAAANATPATRVSMRFLRGLDAHKLEANSAAWRERFHYKEWRQRSRDAPPNLLMASQPFDAHPVGRAFWGATPEPDAIIFNSCAWAPPRAKRGAPPPRRDLPQINRSHYYYPYMVPGYPCPRLTPRLNVTVRLREARAARVVGAPCVKRATNLSDDQIIDDYEKRLRAALVLLRRRFRGRLILRSCHSGTQDRREATHAQFDALRQMDGVLRRVAAELCVEVLDVFELDRLAGYYREKRPANFHVPKAASAQAALAALLQLRLGVGPMAGGRGEGGAAARRHAS